MDDSFYSRHLGRNQNNNYYDKLLSKGLYSSNSSSSSSDEQISAEYLSIDNNSEWSKNLINAQSLSANSEPAKEAHSPSATPKLTNNNINTDFRENEELRNNEMKFEAIFSSSIMNLLHYAINRAANNEMEYTKHDKLLQNDLRQFSLYVESLKEMVTDPNYWNVALSRVDLTFALDKISNSYAMLFKSCREYINILYYIMHYPKDASLYSVSLSSPAQLKDNCVKLTNNIMRNEEFVLSMLEFIHHKKSLNSSFRYEMISTWLSFVKDLLMVIYNIMCQTDFGSDFMDSYHRVSQGDHSNSNALEVALHYYAHKIPRMFTLAIGYLKENVSIKSSISSSSEEEGKKENDNFEHKKNIYSIYKTSMIYSRDLICSQNSYINESLQNKSKHLSFIKDNTDKLYSRLGVSSEELDPELLHNLFASLINLSEKSQEEFISAKQSYDANKCYEDYKASVKPNFNKIHEAVSKKHPKSNHQILMIKWKKVHNTLAKVISKSRTEIALLFKNKRIKSSLIDLEKTFATFESTISNSNSNNDSSQIKSNAVVNEQKGAELQINSLINEKDEHKKYDHYAEYAILHRMTSHIAGLIESYFKDGINFNESTTHESLESICKDMNMISSHLIKNGSSEKIPESSFFDKKKIANMSTNEILSFIQGCYTIQGIMNEVISKKENDLIINAIIDVTKGEKDKENSLTIDGFLDFFRGGSLESLIIQFCVGFTEQESINNGNIIVNQAKQIGGHLILLIVKKGFFSVNVTSSQKEETRKIIVDKYVIMMVFALTLIKLTRRSFPDAQPAELMELKDKNKELKIEKKIESSDKRKPKLHNNQKGKDDDLNIDSSITEKQKSNLAERINDMLNDFKKNKFTQSIIRGRIQKLVLDIHNKLLKQKNPSPNTCASNLIRLGLGLILESEEISNIPEITTQVKLQAREKLKEYY